MIQLYTQQFRQLHAQLKQAELNAKSFGDAMVALLPFRVGDTIQYSPGVMFRVQSIRFDLHCYMQPGTGHFVPGFRATGTQTIGQVSGSTQRHAVFDLEGQRVTWEPRG